ncbi:MAG: DegT/DnrJ/EryC1/StrS family aminotransferase [Paludibacteraceae bacterium]|nr:DegT/DnrJ/EryC1/StrS family aminotransferase [Paludibacteraceae bacterium]
MDYKSLFPDFSTINQNILYPDFSLDDVRQYLGEGVKFKLLKSVHNAFRTALQFCNVAEGDIVLVQSMGARYALDTALSLRASPILIDSEASNWNISAMMVEMVINQCVALRGVRPKAVVVKHHLGVPAFMDEVSAVCKRHQIPLIEDCIGAMGARFEDKLCGTMGQYAVYSLANPQNPADGVGLLIHAVPEFEGYLDMHLKHDQVEFTDPLGGTYSYADFTSDLERRRQIYEKYLAAFIDVEGLDFYQKRYSYIHPNNAYSPLVIDQSKTNVNRDDVIAALEEAGFKGYCPFLPSLNTIDRYKDVPFYGCRVGKYVSGSGLILPSQPSLTDQNVDDIIQIVLDTLDKKK